MSRDLLMSIGRLNALVWDVVRESCREVKIDSEESGVQRISIDVVSWYGGMVGGWSPQRTHKDPD